MGTKNAYCRTQKQTFGHLPILTVLLKRERQHIFKQNSDLIKHAFITTSLKQNAIIRSGNTQNPPAGKKFKTGPLAGKVMLTLFWDEKVPILGDYIDRGLQSIRQVIVIC